MTDYRLSIKDLLIIKQLFYVIIFFPLIYILVVLGELLLEWEGLQARIIRPDVQAVNGVIHVIDRVMMKRRDLTKSGSPIGQQSPAYLPVILAFALIAIFF